MQPRSFSLLKVFLALVAFALTAALNLSAQPSEKVIYTFTGGSDGSSPQYGLVSDGKGNLFGTAGNGGMNVNCTGCGTVFELSPGANGTWTFKVIYSFTSVNGDGSGPDGGLVFDGQGNLYGTTIIGGSSYQGTVYELSPKPNGTWSEKVIYSFTGGVGGSFPYSTTLILDAAGNLYGTTENGGAYGFGLAFELVKGSNGTWTENVLHSFADKNDGGYPYASPLLFDTAGNLYGSSPSAGAHDYGNVFQLARGTGGTWAEKPIYAFTGAAGSSGPIGGLLFDSAGNIYGVSSFNVFELTPGSDGSWSEKSLYTFAGNPDGAAPEAGLIFDNAGNLYGTTTDGGVHRGTVFELTPGTNGAWTERVLHRFQANGTDGIFPGPARLVRDSGGNLYGTTSSGGANNEGVIYEVTP
ncbi:MAG: choice-of-anchor tandem repeat GloVer-containing protein [Candidatus Sulfotelmatobacter sp.]|jgi:uncharacterized repeat protein (TIGR03803 family)